MPPVSIKRPPPVTPEERAPKRLATSSPEEGEVDDAPPPSQPPSPSPQPEVRKPKVAFPFKPKPPGPGNNAGNRRVLPVYIRPEADLRRFQEDFASGSLNPRKGYDNRRRPHDFNHQTDARIGYDSYRPSYDNDGRDRQRERPPSPQHAIHERPVRARTPISPPPRLPSEERRVPHRLPRASYQSPSPPPIRPVVYDRSYAETDVLDRRWKREESVRLEARDRDRSERVYEPDRSLPEPSSSRHSPPYTRSPVRHSSVRPKDRATTPASLPPFPPKKEVLHFDEERRPVAILLPRPTTPVNKHSPPTARLPPKPTPIAKEKLTEEPPRTDGSAKRDRSSILAKKRVPVKRTREEEKEVYHRVFIGCGQRDDYDVTTKLGEGTFGEVHKAVRRADNASVAIKRILMHNEKEGMPVTALREIKILKALKHPCIVELLDMFVVPSDTKDQPMSVYMVFPYMDHDLAGLLENERVKMLPSQIKLYMKQLLEGTEYLHMNHIIHRDMKAANLLISNAGVLRIADFGLARAYDPSILTRAGKYNRQGRERKYTNCVVTRWYRPPELLLGARQYGGEVDIWGVGCVLGEMFFRRPILPGTSDLDQLEKIWTYCGSPNQQNWPGFDELPGCEGVKRFEPKARQIKRLFENLGKETCDLLDKLLVLDPRERMNATQALDHEYFWSDPLPADPKTLPVYEPSHEYDQRGRRNQLVPFEVLPQPALPGNQHAHPSNHNLPPPLHIRKDAYQQQRNGFRNGPPGPQPRPNNMPWNAGPPIPGGPHPFPFPHPHHHPPGFPQPPIMSMPGPQPGWGPPGPPLMPAPPLAPMPPMPPFPPLAGNFNPMHRHPHPHNGPPGHRDRPRPEYDRRLPPLPPGLPPRPEFVSGTRGPPPDRLYADDPEMDSGGLNYG